MTCELFSFLVSDQLKTHFWWNRLSGAMPILMDDILIIGSLRIKEKPSQYPVVIAWPKYHVKEQKVVCFDKILVI